ncbi:MAG TPA: OmpA family protein [Acetobacteraceae bacterium]|nr:OmpA family protein [Acetobacteraceae bacterium]
MKGLVQVGYGLAAISALLLLSGCSSLPGSMNPVSWWHDLQGGKIAEERPPPPGADQPYPNLASVPPKPATPDRAALANIASALVADRTNAQHVAAAAPIADPSSPSASPELFGKGTVPPPSPAPPPGSQQASATMPAVEAPPTPPTPASQPASSGGTASPPAKAPVGNVQTAPLAPPGATAQPPAVAAGAPPAMPTAPPPPPNLPGAPSAPSATAASPPPVSPAAPTSPAPGQPATSQVAAATPGPAPPGNPANTVSVTFVNGSAELPPNASDTLKQLAARRGNGIIAVTGYGDADSDSPDAQSAALALGLSRAQAMAGALTKAGVPASAVQVDAEAIGRGATARLVQ